MITFLRILFGALTIFLIPGIIITSKSTLEAIGNLLWYLGIIWLLGYNTIVENYERDKELEELRKLRCKVEEKL